LQAVEDFEPGLRTPTGQRFKPFGASHPSWAPKVGPGFVGLKDGEPQFKGTCTRTGVVVPAGCWDCNQGWFTYRSCNKLDCATCSERMTKRRGARYHELTGRYGYGVWVITVPASFRSRLSVRKLVRLRKVCIEAIRASYDGVDVGGRYWWHPTGDRCNGCKVKTKETAKHLAHLGRCPRCHKDATWSPHLNVLVPLLGARPGSGGKGKLERLPRFLDSDQLDQVKGAVAALFKEYADELGLEAPVANVNYEYRKPGGKAGHAARYFGRVFAAWKYHLKQLGNGRDFGLASGLYRFRYAHARAWAESVKLQKTEHTSEDKPETCPFCDSERVCYGQPVAVDGRRFIELLETGHKLWQPDTS